MPIPLNHMHRFAYHITHFDNLDSIIEHGLLCTTQKIKKGISHKNIAESGIQSRRESTIIPGTNNLTVHDFVPFYFAKRTPMQLAVINKKNIDQELMIYIAVPISIIQKRSGSLFTDASANTDIMPRFYLYDESHLLDNLNWDMIEAKKWSYPNDKDRHEKMAELLIPNQLQLGEASHIVTWNDSTSNLIKEKFKYKNTPHPQIVFDSDHYFTLPPNFRVSIATGPVMLKKFTSQSIEKITSKIHEKKKFQNIDIAVSAVKANFLCIKELADIEGLKANYGPHKDDVGTHSRRVADFVRRSDEFRVLSPHNQAILEMAAYLHDIGKGPKTRWNNNLMHEADNDHAKKSLPMLERILTEDIGGLPEDSIRKLVTLVVYDDLLGEIVAKGRDEEQLYEIINSNDDIDMLVILSRADIQSLSWEWYIKTTTKIELLRLKVKKKIQDKNQ
jgi:hypothetical protein